jgi:hypothetical protein
VWAGEPTTTGPAPRRVAGRKTIVPAFTITSRNASLCSNIEATDGKEALNKWLEYMREWLGESPGSRTKAALTYREVDGVLVFPNLPSQEYCVPDIEVCNLETKEIELAFRFKEDPTSDLRVALVEYRNSLVKRGELKLGHEMEDERMILTEKLLVKLQEDWNEERKE